MRIAEIGYNSPNPSVDTLTFASEKSILDYDVVLWRPEALIDEYADAYTQSDAAKGPLLSVRASNDLLADSRRRGQEILQFLDRGRTLIICPPTTRPLRVHVIEEIHEFDLLEPLPERLKRNDVPKEISIFRGGNPFRRFAEQSNFSAEADVSFQDFPGAPLFISSNGSAVHGGYIYRHPGHLLFIPESLELFPDRHLVPLITLVETLESKSIVPNLPDWVRNHKIAGEEQDRQILRDLLTAREETSQRICQVRQNLKQIDQRKILLCSTGERFFRSVKETFEATGALVLPTNSDERSLFVESGERFLAVLTIGKDDEAPALDRMTNLIKQIHSEYRVRAKGVFVCAEATPPAGGIAHASTLPNRNFFKKIMANNWLYISGVGLLHLYGSNSSQDLLDFLFSAAQHQLENIRGISQPSIATNRSMKVI